LNAKLLEKLLHRAVVAAGVGFDHMRGSKNSSGQYPKRFGAVRTQNVVHRTYHSGQILIKNEHPDPDQGRACERLRTLQECRLFRHTCLRLPLAFIGMSNEKALNRQAGKLFLLLSFLLADDSSRDKIEAR